MLRKTIEGELFHEIEKFGEEEYRHIGFRDKDNSFGDMMESLVPKVGMRKKAKIMIEVEEETDIKDKVDE